MVSRARLITYVPPHDCGPIETSFIRTSWEDVQIKTSWMLYRERDCLWTTATALSLNNFSLVFHIAACSTACQNGGTCFDTPSCFCVCPSIDNRGNPLLYTSLVYLYYIFGPSGYTPPYCQSRGIATRNVQVVTPWNTRMIVRFVRSYVFADCSTACENGGTA